MLQHIEYAKTKSYATMKREDPNFVPPTSVHAQGTVARLGTGVLNGDGKRLREGRTDENERESKKERVDDDDDDGEEMEIDDDEETGAKGKSSG
jgi:U2 small nuclear ribonucleoprotein B''